MPGIPRGLSGIKNPDLQQRTNQTAPLSGEAWNGQNVKFMAFSAGSMTRKAFSAACLLVLFLTACVHAPLNKMLTPDAASNQVGFVPRPPQADDDGVVIMLFFSGGGTRAAAFSYGVLKELSLTPVPNSRPPRRLLDDVEAVAAVSGGSFTAAYYCLYHDRIFEDYESRFLKKNVQGALALRVLNPFTWPKLLSPYYGRSDLAAEYYDSHIFSGAKFGDLIKAGGRPYLAINSTDMATGEHFIFNDTRFGLISSDLNDYPIARAVAASSAIPLVLTPLTVKNYAGAPGAAKSDFLIRKPDAAQLSHRERQVLGILHSYADAKNRPYIHLVDGGYADNLGLESLLDDAIGVGGIAKLLARGGMRQPKRLVAIVVNAAAFRGEEWNKREAVPSILTSILTLGDQSGARADYQELEDFRDALEDWKKSEREKQTPSDIPPDYYLFHVGFDAIRDKEEKSFFRSLLTTFNLPDATVDRLTAAAGEILRDSPEYQRLLADLKTTRRSD
jgi:NTE family protein